MPLTDIAIRKAKRPAPGDKPLKLRDGNSLYLEVPSQHAMRWRYDYIRQLERDIFPWMGKRSVAEITATELLKHLERIEQRGPPFQEDRGRDMFPAFVVCGPADY